MNTEGGFSCTCSAGYGPGDRGQCEGESITWPGTMYCYSLELYFWRNLCGYFRTKTCDFAGYLCSYSFGQGKSETIGRPL